MRALLALTLIWPLVARAVEGAEERLRRPGVDVFVAKVLSSEPGKPPHVKLLVEEVLKGGVDPHVELDAIWSKGPGKTPDRPDAGERMLIMGKRDGKRFVVDPICRWPFTLAKRAWIMITVRGT